MKGTSDLGYLPVQKPFVKNFLTKVACLCSAKTVHEPQQSIVDPAGSAGASRRERVLIRCPNSRHLMVAYDNSLDNVILIEATANNKKNGKIARAWRSSRRKKTWAFQKGHDICGGG
ncbi:MAG: hypothetical protein C4576_23250 [Desulfobacteraceae bacterium]|nr:MAG: hypothetical protein C4576_23250 [Desulfobacteraceae bacterium]